MKASRRGVSSAALIVGFISAAVSQAAAQTVQVSQPAVETAGPQAAPDQAAPAAEQEPASDKVIITGTLIAGASEDAPLPVEVYDLEALTQQGAPTAAEFLRSLTISSEAAGEMDSIVAGAAAGQASVNLRGLGPGRTLVLFNGNRFNTGSIQDINTLPSMVVGRIDVLKDGASVTYGAGAVGGVINYITRQNFDGFEATIEKKMFDGSDGEDNIELLWGKDFESSNLLVGASYGKRHPLAQTERDYAQLPWLELPGNYGNTPSNPTQYVPVGTTTAIRDYTPASCTAIGGVIRGTYDNTATVGPLSSTTATANDCAQPLTQLFDLINEEVYTRGYLEYNSDISNSMRFHFELAYAKTENPNIKTGTQAPSSGNVAQTSGTAAYSIPYRVPTYSPTGAPLVANCAGAVIPVGCVQNPFVQEFYDRAIRNGTYTGAARTDLDPVNFFQWRPSGIGPNGASPTGFHLDKQRRERWGAAVKLSGEFVEDGLFSFLTEANTGYELSAYYSQYRQTSERPDVIISRLQDALNGYGGAGCQAIDRVPTNYASTTTYDATIGIQSDAAPGRNGCVFFNPFASAYQQGVVGGSNPAFNPANAATYGVASFENSPELWDWLTHDRRFETTNTAMTINATLNGEVPRFELPGGSIAWAVGSEWRQTETRGVPLGSAEEIAIAGQRCPWNDDMRLAPTTPGLAACYADRGPFFAAGAGPQRPFQSDRQVVSVYGELQFPVLDNLNIQLAGRSEKYADITGNIWKIAGKYDVLPDLGFRASYSTNFQAPPDELGASGVVAGTAYVGSLGRSIATSTITAPGITPEDDTAMNFGVIYAPEVFGGELRASLDFWEIIIDKEVGDTTLAAAFSSVFRNPTSGAPTTSPTNTSLVVCNAPLASLLSFTQTCNDTAPIGNPLRTTGANLMGATRYTLNTGGYTTNGVDFAVDYTRDLGPGTIHASIQGTNVLVYKVKGYDLPDGSPYQESFDGLAWANLSRGGTIMPRWRANATLGYSLNDHRLSVRANYFSGFRDDSGNLTGNTTPVARVGTTLVYPKYGVKPFKDYMDFDLNYIYTAPFWQDLMLRVSVLNLFDKNPLAAQHSNGSGVATDARAGYYPNFGNVRGRQFEIGLTKKF